MLTMARLTGVCGVLLSLAVAGLAQQGAAAGLGGPAAAKPGRPAATGDWPMYGHDLSRSNHNPDETLITPASVTHLVSRWQINIGTNGTGPAGAPSVANGRVYVGSSVASGPNFFAFDAVSGTLDWSTNLHYVSECTPVGIATTPAVSGTVLVAGGADDAYYGINAISGTLLWRQAMNAGPSAKAWASPLLAAGRAYLGISSDCDNPSVRGELRALDLQTGALLGRQYFVPAGQVGGGIWNSPALSPDGQTLVVATGEDNNGYEGAYVRALVALDPLSLTVGQWHQQGTPNLDDDFGSTPIVFHDATARTLVGANHKNGTFYTYVLNNVNAGPLWQRNTGTSVGMMPAYDPTTGSGGTLFIASDSGLLYAVDPASGLDRWPPVMLGEMHGNMALTNGLIFVNRNSAGLQVLSAADGHLVAVLDPGVGDFSNSGPVIANGFIYWLTGAYLNAWSLPSPPTPTVTPGGPPPSPPPCMIPFSDVYLGDYFYEPVHYLFCQGILSGYGDGTFRPYAQTTRGQMTKIVVTAFAVPAYTPATPDFSDVPASAPFYPFIEAAAHAGIVSGYADGTFRPGADVTRGQLAKITVAAAGWPLVTPAVATFADVPPGSPFYPFVETASCRGIISGYTCGGPGEPCDGQNRRYFRSAAQSTRGQISKIVDTALQGAAACTPARPAGASR